MAHLPQSWMKDIDDNTLLSQITIPGTHDTCALYGGDLPICQTMSVIDQLKHGIRALDIRCRHYYNRFPIHHDIIFQNTDFFDVQQSCIYFLKTFPSETIIMHIKEEWNPEGNTESFETTFLDYISPYPQYWALGNHIPTLGSVRGKIVLLRRFELNDPGTVLGIKALPWLDNQIFALNNEARLQIQDQYNVPTIFNVVDKWNVIENCIYEAAANSDNILFVNFTSGASGGAYPYTIAKGYPGESGINKRLEDFLEANPQFRHCGIIYLNFPEYPQLTLLSTIYSLNSFKRKVIINEPHIPVIKKRQSRH